MDPALINLAVSAAFFGLLYVLWRVFAAPSFQGSGMTAAADGSLERKGNVIKCLSLKHFRELVAAREATVCDFTATWCSPCQYVKPVFARLSLAHPDAQFVAIDVDECPDVKAECQVRAMPTFIFYRNGERIEELVGADAAKLTALVHRICK